MGDVGDYCASLCDPKDRRPIYDYALDRVILGPPLTKTGPFDVSTSRHLIGPFDSFQNETKREVNLMAPVRGAKTLFADVCHQWIFDIQPGPSLFLFQDEKAAKDQAELRTWPNIMRNETARNLLSDNRHQNRTLDIIFPHMAFHIRGPADSNLQSRGYQYVFLDEPWQYKEGKMEEARGRLGDYVKMGTDKLVCLSQGGFIGSDWDRQFNRGKIHAWHIQCMKCGVYTIPYWSGTREDGSRWGMRWDEHKTSDGLWDITKCLPTVRWECRDCGHPHIWGARTKSEWNRTGKYVAEEGKDKLPSKDSFTWNATIDYPWPELLDLYLQAVNAWKTGVTEPLIQFFQKRIPGMVSEESLIQGKINFAKFKYEINSKPEDGVRLLTFDRQAEDVYWVMARDWWPNGKSKYVWFGKLHGKNAIEDKRKELGVEPFHVLGDSGYIPKGDHGVYAMCIEFGWIPLKGVALANGEPMYFTHRLGDTTVQRTYSEPIPVDAEQGTSQGGRRFVEMIKFSSPTYSDRVSNLIDRGLWLEPDGLDGDPMYRECKTQMAAEYKKVITVGSKATTRTKTVWVCPSGNNHARDCAKEQAVGATLLDFLPDVDIVDSV